MNKAERAEKKKRLYLQRLKLVGSSDEGIVNHNSFRTTGTPCSCAICSPGLVEEKPKYQKKKRKEKPGFWGEDYY